MTVNVSVELQCRPGLQGGPLGRGSWKRILSVKRYVLGFPAPPLYWNPPVGELEQMCTELGKFQMAPAQVGRQVIFSTSTIPS
jgi:hypothetical protein